MPHLNPYHKRYLMCSTLDCEYDLLFVFSIYPVLIKGSWHGMFGGSLLSDALARVNTAVLQITEDILDSLISSSKHWQYLLYLDP